MELLRSALIQAPHGFLTRQGGVSQGVWASLNLSFDVGDDARHVSQNIESAARAAGVQTAAWVTVKQVHSARVVSAQMALAGPIEADGLHTDAPGVALAIRTADCVPVLLEARGGSCVAALHAGWRGVIDDIVGTQLSMWAAQGIEASEVRAALGPAIQACCFEVDGDLPARFAQRFGSQVVVPIRGKRRAHLDLHLALRLRLQALGVTAVDSLGACTVCDGRFFSHRRDAGQTGRHASFIGARG